MSFRVKFVLLGLVVFLLSCNWQPTANNEGLVSELNDKDSLLAINGEGSSDSLSADSIIIDNTRNTDTALMKPSATINTNNVDPNELVNFARTLIGTPYVYGSTDPKKGFDCSGFITYVFNHFGIAVPRSSIDFTDVGKHIPVENARTGDIILFTGTNPQETAVGHMGIVVSNTDSLRFIHSTSGKAMGVTITPLNKYYQARFVKTIRVFAQNEGQK
jgi:cell wall-associated NlpC family hydrolase